MEQNGKTFTAVNLKNINIQVDGVTVYLNGDTLHVIDNYNPGKIKDLQEEITILREQLRGTREELAEGRKQREEAMEKHEIAKRVSNIQLKIIESKDLVIESLKYENTRLKELVKKLEFMVQNGLGPEDMINDIKYPTGI